jgi:hypothetical protein
MRFMGDHPLAKSQKDIDCIYFVLQVCYLNCLEILFFQYSLYWQNKK